MNILYCGDKNISDGLVLSVMSLLRHARQPLNIFVLTMSYAGVQPLPEGVTDGLRRHLWQHSPGSTVTRIDATTYVAAQPPAANMDTRFTPCCMLRLYADLVPELPDRLLYLDTDVLCRKDFQEMYHMDLEGCRLAGVPDRYGKWFFRRRFFQMDYVNSGVLLLDLKAIRQTGLFDACRRRCGEKKMFMPDQSAVNKLCADKKLLPRRWNEQHKLRPDTVFQHFTTQLRFFPRFHTVSVKPWQIDKLHTILKLHEYDELLAEFTTWKETFSCLN